jgi:hypothetical protein
MSLDWNVIAEIVLGVIIYKIVDSLFNLIFRGLRRILKKMVN